MFMRQTFLCNSPDSVQFAFSQKNASFERKAPQMRYALEPLLGDGLFISDGETWRKRRRMVAPIVHVSRLTKFAPIMVEAAQEVETAGRKSEGATVDVLVEVGDADRRDHLPHAVRTQARARLRPADRRRLQRISARYRPEQIFFRCSDCRIGFRVGTARAIGRSVKSIHDVLDHVIESYRAQTSSEDSSVISQLLDARDRDWRAARPRSAAQRDRGLVHGRP